MHGGLGQGMVASRGVCPASLPQKWGCKCLENKTAHFEVAIQGQRLPGVWVQ